MAFKVRKPAKTEMLDKRVDHFIRDERFATAVGSRLVPIDCENTPQLVVRVCYSPHCAGEHFPEIGGSGLNVPPAAAFRDGEAVLPVCPKECFLLFSKCSTLLPLLFCNCVIGFILPLVAKSLIKHEGEDVVFVVLPGGLAAQDVGRTPEMVLKLLLCKPHTRQ